MSARICLLLLSAPALAFGAAVHSAEVSSPESFLREKYGWTIKGVDEGRGFFGDYRAFACFDDRLGPPATEEESAKRRWGTQCNTVRSSGENLGAMMFVSWINPRHPKPQSIDGVFESAANQMAGSQKDQGSETRCGEPEIQERGGKRISLYDCQMVLPFGTYFASFVRFDHRNLEFVIRLQNASASPIPKVPNEAARKLLPALAFD